MATAMQSPIVKELTLTRIFNAPRKVVFKAWTDRDQFAEWWGPKYFTNPVCEIDVRVGGQIKVDMTQNNGQVYPMGGEFREIDEPNRLVFTTTTGFDATGKPMLENLNTITFEDMDGKTKLTLHVKVLHATPEMDGALSGMEMGWSQTLDKLADLLAKH